MRKSCLTHLKYLPGGVVDGEVLLVDDDDSDVYRAPEPALVASVVIATLSTAAAATQRDHIPVIVSVIISGSKCETDSVKSPASRSVAPFADCSAYQQVSAIH